MTETDLLQRFIFEKAPVRGEYVHLQKSYIEIAAQHDYPPALRHFLGEALCVASLLTATIKFEGRLTLQFRGEGKLSLLLVQCNHQFHLRGVAQWDKESGELTQEDILDSLKKGHLVITLDSGPGKQYQGVVAWRGRSLAESIEGYFKDSEQLNTKIWLSVDEISAVGLLLQVVPGVGEFVKGVQEEVIGPHWSHITQLTNEVTKEAMLTTRDYRILLSRLYPEEEVRLFPATEVKFQCTCSRQRCEGAIRIMGREDAEDELKTNRYIVVTCDFCNKEYEFDRADVAQIFAVDDQAPPSQLH